MKNLILLSAIVIIFSCSKKNDPTPAKAFDKKVYYRFEVLAGSTDGLYYNGKIEMNNGYTKNTPTYQYSAATGKYVAYMLLPGLDTTTVKANVTQGRFTPAWGTSPTNLKIAPSGMFSGFYLVSQDTCYVLSFGSGLLIQ